MDRDMKANIMCDIQDWDYEADEGHYDFIWASPPCTEYSCAKTVGVRDLDGADATVIRTLQIIQHFKPTLGFVIENPQTGLLKDRDFMQEYHYNDVDYCKYGMPYRKRTRLWNNLQHIWKPRELCRRDCESIQPGTKRHKHVAQRGPNTKSKEKFANRFKQSELYRVPGMLVHEILTAISPPTVSQVSSNIDSTTVAIEL